MLSNLRLSRTTHARILSDPCQDYQLMYYKTQHRIGIRDKRSTKQILQFGGQDFNAFSRDQLWEVGKEVRALIVDGKSVEETKAFANTKL